MTRHLKIFISSTFQDMQEEREILLKETFLELKKIAKSRDVEVTEIDLRTGITKEQEQNGEIVKLCLDEIERCSDSPIFFLGMLGNRYGWKEWHKYTNQDTLEDNRYSWVTEHIGKSVTELEIISAIERDKEHNKAFIYLKDGIDDDIELTELKNRLIEKSKINNNLSITHYKDGVEFRKKIIDSFTKALDELYPKDEKISEVEKLRASHKIFAKSRQKVYISHRKNESILDEFIESSQDRLLLYGESGLGKSALIANHFEKFKKRSDVFVIEHYIGGAGELSNDLQQMLRRVMLEIKEEFELSDEVPIEPQKIMDEFALWLHRVKRPTIIILDGYNQIEDELKEKLFYYISEKLEHVKLIITSIKKSYPIDNSHQIEPLTQEEQRVLIVDYLKGYGKTIDQRTQTQIVKHPQTNNTLFLRTLLNEIRLLGNFEGLQEDINNYLTAKDVVELFIKIFERLERDYRENLAKEVLSLLYVSRDGLSEDNLMEIINQNTTKKLTRLEFSPLFLAIEEHLINRGGLYGFFHDFIRLAVKNRYLSEKELVDGERRKIADYFEGREIDNQRVRELPFQLFELGDRERLYILLIDINFFLDVYKNEIYDLLKYIKLIDYNNNFSNFIKKTYINRDYSKNYLSTNIVEKLAYFMFEIYNKYDISVLLYIKILDIERTISPYDFRVAFLLNKIGAIYKELKLYDIAIYHIKQALKIYEIFKYKSIKSELYSLEIFESFSLLSLIYNSKGETTLALEYHNKASLYIKSELNYLIYYHNDFCMDIKAKKYNYSNYELNRHLIYFLKKFKSNSFGLLVVINNIASQYIMNDNYVIAEKLYKKILTIIQQKLEKKNPLIISIYDNIGTLYYHKNNFKKALFFKNKALEISKKLFINSTYYIKIELEIEEIRECINLKTNKNLYISSGEIKFGKYHIKTALSYKELGDYYSSIKDYNLSYIFYSRALRIRRYILGDDNIETAISYNDLGWCYKLLNNFEKALILYLKACRIRERILSENHIDLAISYDNLSKLFYDIEEYDKSYTYNQKALKIWRNISTESQNLMSSYYAEGILELRLNKKILNNEFSKFIHKKENIDIYNEEKMQNLFMIFINEIG